MLSGHRIPPARKRAHNSHTGCGGAQVLSGLARGVIDQGNSVAGQSHAQQRLDSGGAAVPSEGLSVEFTEQLCPGLKPPLASRADGQVTCAVVDE
jgi:hypothetical protein